MWSRDHWQQKYPASLLKMQVPRLCPRPMESEPWRAPPPGASPALAPSWTDSGAGPFHKEGIVDAPLSSLEQRGGWWREVGTVILYLLTITASPWQCSSKQVMMAEGPLPCPILPPAQPGISPLFASFLLPVGPAGVSQPLPSSPRPHISSSTGFKQLLPPSEKEATIFLLFALPTSMLMHFIKPM